MIIARDRKSLPMRWIRLVSEFFAMRGSLFNVDAIRSTSPGSIPHAVEPLTGCGLRKRRDDLTTIVAVHEPDYIWTLFPAFPVDLQLSGHSHGGQVRLSGVGPLILPPMGEIYNMGLYRVGNAQLYTTRGIGTIHVNARFNCPPEVTAITLHV